MKGILIKPVHERASFSVAAVDVRPRGRDVDLAHVCELLGCAAVEPMDLDAFDGHFAYADEEGLYEPTPGYLLAYSLSDRPIAGSLVLLAGEPGNARDVALDPVLVSRLLQGAYCTPKQAYDRLKAAEDEMRRRYPGAIVMSASELIRSHLSVGA